MFCHMRLWLGSDGSAALKIDHRIVYSITNIPFSVCVCVCIINSNVYVSYKLLITNTISLINSFSCILILCPISYHYAFYKHYLSTNTTLILSFKLANTGNKKATTWRWTPPPSRFLDFFGRVCCVTVTSLLKELPEHVKFIQELLQSKSCKGHTLKKLDIFFTSFSFLLIYSILQLLLSFRWELYFFSLLYKYN